eukprot:5309922-Pyramimonas_sp.AAC.1
MNNYIIYACGVVGAGHPRIARGARQERRWRRRQEDPAPIQEMRQNSESLWLHCFCSAVRCLLPVSSRMLFRPPPLPREAEGSTFFHCG